MAMMMTGRVLLVCALCVLWCGIAGGGCDEGVVPFVDSPAGSVNGGEGGPGSIPYSSPGTVSPKPSSGVGEEETLITKGPPEVTEEVVKGDVDAEDGETPKHKGRISEQPTQKKGSREETPEGTQPKNGLEDEAADQSEEEREKKVQQSQSQQHQPGPPKLSISGQKPPNPPPSEQFQVQITTPTGRGGQTAPAGPPLPPAPAEPSSRDGGQPTQPTDSRNPSQESHDKSLSQATTESSAN
ncbi:mucin-associated surface protein (MASP), putative [Trypanosoma cruzi marinkellei]|uniref:Mucin-associated surface protein (MASP), putative n=1 Tax=Trypanosoma cruzi marinkellei TaxID=85056 RepID=K2MYE6_TRYCR|nr:mucin-associated surface protein (MASP), putative [Trypanosoma cruzi marinkellei]